MSIHINDVYAYTVSSTGLLALFSVGIRHNMSVNTADIVIGMAGKYFVLSPPEQNTITHSNDIIQKTSNKMTPIPKAAILLDSISL
jgi:hypothetical protein